MTHDEAAARTRELVPTPSDKAQALALTIAHTNLDLDATIRIWNEIVEGGRGWQVAVAQAELLIAATGLRGNQAAVAHMQRQIAELTLIADASGESGESA